jgi:hypothetical protein
MRRVATLEPASRKQASLRDAEDGTFQFRALKRPATVSQPVRGEEAVFRWALLAMLLWICLFIGYTLVCAWIVLGDGADSTPGMFFAVLSGADPRNSERGMKIAVGATWLFTAILFYWWVYQSAFTE